jgi:hypothetical protein
MRNHAGRTRRWRPRLEPLEERFLLSVARGIPEVQIPAAFITTTQRAPGSLESDPGAPAAATLASTASPELPEDNDNDPSERADSAGSGPGAVVGPGGSPPALLLAYVSNAAETSTHAAPKVAAGVTSVGTPAGSAIFDENVPSAEKSSSNLTGPPRERESNPAHAKRFEGPPNTVRNAWSPFSVLPRHATFGSPLEPTASPRGAGLITHLFPFELSSLNRAFERVLGWLPKLEAAAPRAHNTGFLGPLLLLHGMAIIALETARMRLVRRTTGPLRVKVLGRRRFPRFHGTGRFCLDWTTE